MEAATETGTTELKDAGIPSGFILNKKTIEVVMRAGEAKITHVFKRPTLNNWTDYLNDLKPGFLLNEAKGWAATNDEAFAAKALWDNVIMEVTGYKGSIGWQDGDWKKKIPVSHKKIAVNFLQDVWVEDFQHGDAKDDEGNAVFDLEADSRTVVLAATADGFKYDRLVHILKVPTPEQEIRFERTRVHYIRQSGESNRVISPPRLRKMAELYDEIILSVDGYGVEEPSASVQISGVKDTGGKPPYRQVESLPTAITVREITDATDARKYMDALHKQAAVLAVFSQQPAGEKVGADAGGAQAEEIDG